MEKIPLIKRGGYDSLCAIIGGLIKKINVLNHAILITMDGIIAIIVMTTMTAMILTTVLAGMTAVILMIAVTV